MKFGAIILSAGYSSRMNGFKPLLKLGGRSFLGHCITLFRSTGIDTITVITGHNSAIVKKEALLYGATPLFNDKYDEGMFSSVCAGVHAMKDTDGFFVLPVDIPLVRPSTVLSLLSAFEKNVISYPVRDGIQGHPPLIPKKAMPRILEHDGSGGLQKVLKQLPGKNVPVWDDCAFMDADFRDDFDRLLLHYLTRETGTRTEAANLAKLNMQPRGIAHGEAVAQIACTLGERLNEKGYSLNPDILHNGGLLHDIAKGQPNHEEAGGNLIGSLGLTNLVESVAGHKDTVLPKDSQLTEREVVCLADKLVRGTRRMSVNERFGEKLNQYATDKKAVDAITMRMNNALVLQQKVEETLSSPIEEILSSSPPVSIKQLS